MSMYEYRQISIYQLVCIGSSGGDSNDNMHDSIMVPMKVAIAAET
jgi:hypothetical protein